MPNDASARLEREVTAALAKPRRRSRRPKRSAREIQTERLKALRHRMADAIGDDGWMEANLTELESWISVSDELSDHAWLDSAQGQLIDASVLPEHAGAPPPRVRAWNASFISTYLMNVDDGMSREAAIDSARQNANDEVDLEPDERGLRRTDPDLYAKRRRW